MTRLYVAAYLLVAVFGELRAEIPSCKAEQIAGFGKRPVWHITLVSTDGHRFTILQTKNSLDRALATCKQWLKAQTKKKQK